MRRILLILALLAMSCHSAPSSSSSSDAAAPGVGDNSSVSSAQDASAEFPAPGEAPTKTHQRARVAAPARPSLETQAKYKVVPGAVLCADRGSLAAAESQAAQGQSLDVSSGCLALPKGADVVLASGSDDTNARVKIVPVGIGGWTRRANLQQQ